MFAERNAAKDGNERVGRGLMIEAANELTYHDEAAQRRDLHNLVGYQLRRVGALVVKELGRIFGEVGLAPGQFSILTLIAENPGCFQMDLARLARVDRSTLVPVIERLINLKLIARSQSREDRRAYHLNVTARGRKAIEQVTPDLRAFEEAIIDGMGEREKKALLRSLRRVEQALMRQ